ncbi:MAG: hypothetical protein DMG04_30965 [Acidobacteria bacterium]|nr:MAG: hypothetical protein DMG04_30965 [Acidobacteriota bacterium]
MNASSRSAICSNAIRSGGRHACRHASPPSSAPPLKNNAAIAKANHRVRPSIHANMTATNDAESVT